MLRGRSKVFKWPIIIFRGYSHKQHTMYTLEIYTKIRSKRIMNNAWVALMRAPTSSGHPLCVFLGLHLFIYLNFFRLLLCACVCKCVRVCLLGCCLWLPCALKYCILIFICLICIPCTNCKRVAGTTRDIRPYIWNAWSTQNEFFRIIDSSVARSDVQGIFLSSTFH